MAENQLLQLHAIDREDHKESNRATQQDSTTNFRGKDYKWWIRMAMYMIFLLCGQSTAILLGRLYYDQGGQRKWIAALLQTVGFPILFPFYFIPTSSSSSSSSSSPPPSSIPTTINGISGPPSIITLALVYLTLGLLTAGGCLSSSYGFLYLPVSTLSIISASQLGFTALFSFFLNSQKFTPFIINSIVLLTISPTLLAFQPNSSNLNGVSKGKYAIGFICTGCASVVTALVLSLSQFFFRKVIKKISFRAVVEMIIFQSLLASWVILVGLFASKEWKGLRSEMEGFGLGKVSYAMTLVWSAISWQLFQIGAVGLIFEVSSLFCNVMSALALPLIQVLAVIIFHDKINGLKVISMVLAIWGFVSYIYQHYLDDQKSKNTKINVNADADVVEDIAVVDAN